MAINRHILQFAAQQVPYPEKLRGRPSIVNITFETFVEKVLKQGRQLVLVFDIGLAICGYQVEGLNRKKKREKKSESIFVYADKMK